MHTAIILFLAAFFPLHASAVEFSIPELSEEEIIAQATTSISIIGYIQIALFGALALTALLSAYVIARSLLRRSNAIVDEERQRAGNKIIDGLIGLGVVIVSLLVIAIFYRDMFRFEEITSLFT